MGPLDLRFMEETGRSGWRSSPGSRAFPSGGKEGPSSRYAWSETSTGVTQVQNHKNWKGIEQVSKIIF